MARNKTILDRYEALAGDHDPTVQSNPGPPDRLGADELPSPSSSQSEIWMSRTRNFPPQNRSGSEGYQAEMKQVIERYVALALDRGVNPGSHNDQLVEEFLSSHGYSENTKTSYRRHLREWFGMDHDRAD